MELHADFAAVAKWKVGGQRCPAAPRGHQLVPAGGSVPADLCRRLGCCQSGPIPCAQTIWPSCVLAARLPHQAQHGASSWPMLCT